MPNSHSFTSSSDSLTNAIETDYERLTFKGRLILDVLLHDYERNGEEGLTRRDIAEQLGQARLYPHDDKAIRQLEALQFIYISETTKREALYREWDDHPLLQRQHISLYTRFHVHWLQPMMYKPLVNLRKAQIQNQPKRINTDESKKRSLVARIIDRFFW